jgi:hypothetical protein
VRKHIDEQLHRENGRERHVQIDEELQQAKFQIQEKIFILMKIICYLPFSLQKQNKKLTRKREERCRQTCPIPFLLPSAF